MTSLVLQTDRVSLRSLDEPGLRAVIELTGQPGNAFRFRGLGPGSPRASFERITREGVLCQFSIIDNETQRCIGFIQAISPDFRHGTAQLAIILDDRVHRRGWPLEAALLFVNYVFVVHPLRKIYLEVLTPNLDSIGLTGLSTHLEVEGTLSQHEWFLGQYVDATFLSMTREAFYGHELVRSLLGRWADVAPDAGGAGS